MKRILFNITALSIMTVTGTTDAIGASNPLLESSPHPYGTLPFSKLTSAQYEEAVTKGIELHNKEIDAIVESPETPDFKNVIVALDRSGELLNRALLALSNVEHATGDTALMNAMERITPLLSAHSADINLNEELWNKIKLAYKASLDNNDLTPEDRRLAEKTYKSFLLNGADLKGSDREKYRALTSELSNLNLKFAQNVTNAMKDPARRLWLKKEDLTGIPESIMKAYRAAAAETLASEGKNDDGSLYLVTVFRPSYAPFMTYSDRRDLREKLYRLNGSTNNEGEFQNITILKDIANIRLEIATLLGYDNYAAYKLQNTMASTPDAVMEFLSDLNKAYSEPMKKEVAEIQGFARATQGEDFVLAPWDYSYWSDKLKNDRYAFNDEDLKPYFELNNTINGVFGLATKLYGYKFKEVNNIEKYNEDVRTYEVYRKDGSILGLLYADFFYRPGKAPGAWMTEFRAETKDDSGKREIPLISIVCNFSKPVGNDPVLLTADEVNTFLHEFGHAIHGLSAEAKYESLSGTNVEHDFVELFSQFNENYLTEKKFLDTFARHYKTGVKIPPALLNNFIRSSQYGAAYAAMRQLGFGYLDMAYHTITTPLRATQDIEAFESKALEPVKIFEPVEGSLISSSFGHIFSGGYAAGYYGYKWSEELDADAFKAFKETGDIFNPKAASKFLKMLQSGDTVPPMALYIEFRGKKPTVDALLERDGIKGK